MNIKIDNLIKEPNLLNDNTLYYLEQFVKDYPYCQSAHILLAKNHSQNNSNLYDLKLKIAAAYAGNRHKLFEIINQKNVINEHEEKISSNENISESLSFDNIDSLDSILLTDSHELSLHFDEKKENNIEIIETITDNKKKKFDLLIEKFIQEQPRITPNKEYTNQNIDLASKSIIEDEDLVTETLALVYARQGSISKAIKTYEKLCLKIPEKSSYFAAQIENLKKNK